MAGGAGGALSHLRRQYPDHRHRPEPATRARPGRTGVPPLRPHPHAALREAIGDFRREAAEARAREEARARQEEYQAQVRRAAQEQAAKKAAERETRRPICASCGAKFTDERWQATQKTDWGRPKDTHPHLCDDCKHRADTANATAADEQGHQEPVRDGARQQQFQRYARRPVCTNCGAEFTDERWRAVERVGWGTTQEPRPTLCGDCDRQADTAVQQAWPGAHRHQEHDQAVPEQMAGGTWISRFRR